MLRSKETWDKIYQDGNTPWDFRKAEPYLVNLNIRPCSVLDIGCGTGNESILFAKQGFRVTGLDISEQAIKEARKRAKKEKVNVNFVVSNILDFDSKERFDFVLDRACFHFLDPKEREKYIEIIVRVLNRGGLFLLFVSSDKESQKGPYQFSENKLRALFDPYFDIEKIELITLENHFEKPTPYFCQMRLRALTLNDFRRVEANQPEILEAHEKLKEIDSKQDNFLFFLLGLLGGIFGNIVASGGPGLAT